MRRKGVRAKEWKGLSSVQQASKRGGEGSRVRERVSGGKERESKRDRQSVNVTDKVSD